ncbi:MAG: NAD(+)/NADH kinase [Planctomycetes bacterium]|nr:NAD(+)/NADH kinase [Planctomycetota bacterium]
MSSESETSRDRSAPRHLALLGDERKGGTKALVQRHAAWLRERGAEVAVVMDRESSLAELECDAVVVFGGDGSLLGAARRMAANQRPTLGINCGRLGFLTAYEQEQSELALTRLLAGELHEESRLMLSCTAVDADGEHTDEAVLLNDVVVTRRSVGGMIMLRAWRGEIEIATYRGDGLIAATASGSTAYSMAAGGPVLVPSLDALVLTPLASHTLAARPIVLPVGQGIDIEVVETGHKRQASCQIDGQVQQQIPLGGRALLRPVATRFRHLVPSSTHFFHVLHQKFGFADLPRSRDRGGRPR